MQLDKKKECDAVAAFRAFLDFCVGAAVDSLLQPVIAQAPGEDKMWVRVEALGFCSIISSTPKSRDQSTWTV